MCAKQLRIQDTGRDLESMRHFSEITDDEVTYMINVCKEAAANVAEKINMSGLSEGQGAYRSHNVYLAIERAIKHEHERAVAIATMTGRHDKE